MQFRHFDQELEHFKSMLVSMGGKVEKAIFFSIEALSTHQPSLCKKVHDLEKEINTNHLQIDNLCIQLLARQAPIAKDLRFVLWGSKMNTDLERMGDQAVNIAQNVAMLLKHPPQQDFPKLTQMSRAVEQMVRFALDAFVERNPELAKKVIETDDQVDQEKRDMIQIITNLMEKKAEPISTLISLLFVTKNLERLGDHATNIAEDVIFITEGKDIRHESSSL